MDGSALSYVRRTSCAYARVLFLVPNRVTRSRALNWSYYALGSLRGGCLLGTTVNQLSHSIFVPSWWRSAKLHRHQYFSGTDNAFFAAIPLSSRVWILLSRRASLSVCFPLGCFSYLPAIVNLLVYFLSLKGSLLRAVFFAMVAHAFLNTMMISLLIALRSTAACSVYVVSLTQDVQRLLYGIRIF